MAIGDLQQFEHALHATVLAPPAVQCVQDLVGCFTVQALGEVGTGIDLDDFISFLAKRLCAGPAGYKADISFRRKAAEENRYACHAAGRPMRLISHSSCMPDAALTRARTSSPRA